MNTKYKLKWEKFDWEDFQRLSILIAEYKFPACDFQEYLRQGHKQSGTDLQSFDYKNGTFLNVQCKRVENLSVTGLKKIVEDFINNELVQNTSVFILATSFNTNTPDLQKTIAKTKQDLKDNNQIEFHCWGRSDFEKYLKSNWGIVYTYFGKEDADSFCYPQIKKSAFDNLIPINDFIPRNIIQGAKYDPEGFAWDWGPNSRQLQDLIKVLTDNRTISSKICIVGDAYQGKTSYLKQTAYLLKEHPIRLQPLLIEMKDVNVSPIEEVLDKSFGFWKSIPLKDIVIFIDGLDEAPTDKFREMITNIKLFAKSVPAVNIVLSCRKLFYNQLGVKDELNQFELFELSRIQKEQRDVYLKRILDESTSDFIKLTTKAGINGLLEHPFYLVCLVEEYKESQKIPSTKIGVIELFINRAYKNSLKRRIKGGQIIQDESHRFGKVIARFALALQLAGLNAFK